jgi:hypothetical protein
MYIGGTPRFVPSTETIVLVHFNSCEHSNFHSLSALDRRTLPYLTKYLERLALSFGCGHSLNIAPILPCHLSRGTGTPAATAVMSENFAFELALSGLAQPRLRFHVYLTSHCPVQLLDNNNLATKDVFTTPSCPARCESSVIYINVC